MRLCLFAKRAVDPTDLVHMIWLWFWRQVGKATLWRRGRRQWRLQALLTGALGWLVVRCVKYYWHLCFRLITKALKIHSGTLYGKPLGPGFENRRHWSPWPLLVGCDCDSLSCCNSAIWSVGMCRCIPHRRDKTGLDLSRRSGITIALTTSIDTCTLNAMLPSCQSTT